MKESRLRVDPILCDAFGYCAELIPEVVSLDDWGYPIVAAGPIPEWLEKAAQARDPLLSYLKVGPIYDGIRGDVRYADLLYRIGLAQDVTSELRTVTQHESGSTPSQKPAKAPAV